MSVRPSSRTARIIRQRRRQRHQAGNTASRFGRLMGCSLGTLLLLIIGGGLLAVGSGVVVYATYARKLPPANAIVDAQAQAFQTSIFYDRDGTFKLYEVIDPLGGDRQYISINEVPNYFLDATIAIEDASFYKNPGFDVQGMLRALWSNLTSDYLQGGSTITQQLVKNVLIEPDERTAVSVDRKLKEIILAGELSRLYSKDQILEWYVNTNFYGNLAYGVEAAAQVYFDKSARDLTLGEAALLAAIPQSPSQNPLDNPLAARERQRVVLQTMLDQDYITQPQMDIAMSETIVLRPLALRFDITAPHFALYARNEAEKILDGLGYDGSDMVLRRGLKIYTTLDLDLQYQLECVSRTYVSQLASGDPNYIHNTSAGTACQAAEFLTPLPDEFVGIPRHVTNASGVIMRGNTGEIMAMLGSVNFWDATINGEFNAALALRQPASTFKPFVYVTAFINPIDANTVITPSTMTYDVRTEFSVGQIAPYVPENMDRQYHGPVSVREALARSYNVPVVQVLNMVGLNQVLKTAHSMGINSMNESISAYGLSFALGTAEASLLDVTYAYNVFNNNGVMVGTPVAPSEARVGYRQLNPTSILRIESADGEILWAYGEEYGSFDRRAVLEPGMAYLITDILSDNDARISPSFPRGNALELSRPAAAKTGTSDNFRDSWTVGYTPQYTTGIWVGNNDNMPMDEVSGLYGAGAIWHAIMEYAHAKDDLPVEDWPHPSTVVQQDVCIISGLLPNGSCRTISELFFYDAARNIDYRPNRQDTYWITLDVNACNNTLAVPSSRPDCVTRQDFFDYPDELLEWALSNGAALPPSQYDSADNTSVLSPVAILEPQFLKQISGTIEIRGNARDNNLDYFRLDIGQGNAPDTWRQIGTLHQEGGGSIVLETWDTTTVPDGLYTIRLTLVRSDNTSEPAFRQVIVDNTRPTIRLLSPQANASYSADSDVFLELNAEPADNQQVDFVEFYLDGELLGRATDGRYTLRWEIDRQGSVVFWATVYDKAGNQAESDHITINLVP